MKKIFLAIITISVIVVSCSKEQTLNTSPVSTTKTTRILTGGNGNGVQYNREYEVHEVNGTISCKVKGDDCAVGMCKSDNTGDIAALKMHINNNSVPEYFASNQYQGLFPNLSGSIVNSIIANQLFILEVQNFENSTCFVLSSSSTYNKDNIQKVWMYAKDYDGLLPILCQAETCTRNQIISSDGTKVDCTQKGDNCDVGGIIHSNPYTDLDKFETYRLTNDVKSYFEHEQWTNLFPMLTDEQLSRINSNELNILKFNYTNTNSTCYILTSSDNINNINTQNLEHTWVFQN
jgi:hypothetical protein